MPSITTQLAGILDTIRRPGDFYTSGATELFAPSLDVAGVGPIALPLLPAQAEQLIAIADQAPYGRGEETLVDTQVRRTWQIDAARARIEGRHWSRTLNAIVERAATGLGVAQPVAAEFYKLLVYDAGSFFVSHRDTEKAPGMFATLIVVLPSHYTGGELLVRHRDREARLDLRRDDPAEVAFAAFYADCVHEILPVTSGCRLTLVYNLLLRPGNGRLPEPPSYAAEQTAIIKLLRGWIAAKESPADGSPEKLIYPLQHAYTPAALAFDSLKGADAAVASVLIPAAEQTACDLHLALVSIQESGAAEPIDYYDSRRRRGRWDEGEDAFEIVEVCDRIATLSEWRRADGEPSELGDFPFEETDLCPPDAFDNLKPDEQHFHEATGNEGASFERTYRRAGLVLWPRARWIAVLNQAGLSVTLPYLDQLTRRWAEGGADMESPPWREARELAGHMLRTWPKERPYHDYWRRDSPPSDAQSAETRMLVSLTRLRATDRIDAFLAEFSAAGIYSWGDNAALVEALGLLPAARAAELLQRIVAGNAGRALSACRDLLARCTATVRDRDGGMDLVPAAWTLVHALPGDPARSPQPESWRLRPPVEPDFVVDLLTVLHQIDLSLAERAVNQMLAWPKTYGFDSVLVPTALALIEQPASRDRAAFRQLRAACLTHLRARIAEPLEPPFNWTRVSALSCRCQHCTELSRFLADPDRQMWTLKATGDVRGHVEDSIRGSECDLDFTTDKRGRPFTLVCAKNQASYERRVRQRKKDTEDAARLEMEPDQQPR